MRLTILLALLVCITGQHHGIFQLNNTIAMYPDKIGEVKFIKSAWKLVMSFSLDLYNKEIFYTQEILGKSRSICEKIVNLTSETACNKTLAATKPIMENININDLTIKHFFGKGSRTKRSLFNGIGRLANTLFGVLDDNDKDTFEAQFQNLRASEQKTLHITKNQTTLIQSILKVMEKDSKNTVDTFINLRKELKNLNEEIMNVDETVNTNTLVTEFIKFIEQFTLIISLLQNKQMQLLDIFIFAKDHKIHPYLLPIDEYENIISEIKAKLQPGETFPQDPYSIAKVNMHLMKTQSILLEIEIPIIENTQKYTMYEVLPIPKKLEDDMFITLELRYKYLIIDNLKEKYKIYNDKDMLKDCDTQNTTMYCKRNAATYSVFNFKTCISELFVNNDPSLCTTKAIIVKTDLFIPLHNRNDILFVTLHPRSITLYCANENIKSLSINNTGILSVQGSCELRTKDFTMEIGEMQTRMSKFELSALRSLNFNTKTEQDTVEKIKVKKQDIDIQIIENLHEIRELKADSKTLSNANYELENVQPMSHHDISQYSLFTLTFLIVLIIVAIKYCRRKQTVAITEIKLKNVSEEPENTENIVKKSPEEGNKTFNLLK